MPADTMHEGTAAPNRYDPFSHSPESLSPESPPEGGRELAENQPNRVRHENGVMQKLVKYADGKFEWQPVNEQPNPGQGGIETFGGAAQERQLESHRDAEFKTALAKGLDDLEAADQRRVEQVAALEAQVAALQEQLAELTNAKSSEPEKQATTPQAPDAQPATTGEPEPDKDGKDKDPQSTKPIAVPQGVNRMQRAGKRMTFENGKAVIKDTLDKEKDPDDAEGEEGALFGYQKDPDTGEITWTGIPDKDAGKAPDKDPVDPAEKEKQPGFQPEIPPELEKTLADARDEYAKLTAKNRNGFTGHFLSHSKFLTKIAGVKALAERVNGWIDERELGPARDAYKQAVVAIQDEIDRQCYEKFGEDTKEAQAEAKEASRIATMDMAIQSELAFEMTNFASRLEYSGKTNKIVNWWVKQEGLGGKLKKAALVAGVGLTAGLVIGLAGAPLVLGTAAGAMAGGASGAYISRKRASAGGDARDNNEPIEGKDTLADRQSTEDYEHKKALVDQAKDTEKYVRIDDLIGVTEDRTGAEKTGNRGRVRTAAAIGGAAGSFGAGLGGVARSGVDSLMSSDAGATSGGEDGGTSDGGEGSNADGEGSDADTSSQETQDTGGGAEFQNETFDVESGNGYTHELIDFAKANGHNLSPDQSYQLHQDLMRQFGSDYININGAGGDVYTSGGDVRLAEPGSARWAKGVAPFVEQWVTSRGL